MRLPRRARRAALVVHVATSVSWLGLTLGLLGLGVRAVVTASPQVAEASYLSMHMLVDWLVVPVALLSLASGVVLSLGTVWGLARHWWVFTKFWMTLVATAATVFALRSAVGEVAARTVAGQPVDRVVDLVVAPSVSFTLYAFMTAISVLKPWGLTPRGRRLRATTRLRGTADKSMDSPTPRPTT